MTNIVVSFWESENPFELLRSLGITFERSEGQPIADQIKFINCANVPDDLPSAVRVIREDAA